MKRVRKRSVGVQVEHPSDSDAQAQDPKAKRRRERQEALLQKDKACPMGWKLDPKALLYLQDPSYSEMIPGAVPTRFLPRMLPQHLLQLLPETEMPKERLISHSMAKELSHQFHHTSEMRMRINVVLLTNGHSCENAPYSWLLMRLFGDRWRYKELTQNFCLDCGEVEVVTKEANLLWLGPSCRQTIQDASLFVLLIENLAELDSLLEKVVLGLRDVDVQKSCLPPFLCFTSFLQQAVTQEGPSDASLWLESEEEEEIEFCFRKANLRAGFQIISIKEHLSSLKEYFYQHVFIKKWGKNPTLLQDCSFRLPPSSDPLGKASRFLIRSISVSRNGY